VATGKLRHSKRENEDSLFYPLMVLNAGAGSVAIGTRNVLIDDDQGRNPWRTVVPLPLDRSEYVSALSFNNAALIYAGTTGGKVFRLQVENGAWAAHPIHNQDLPKHWIWEIVPVPGKANSIVVAMAEYQRQFRSHPLGDVPVNTLVIDPLNADSMYVGTEAGVSATSNGGAGWQVFSDGLPNTAVYDLSLDPTGRLLRAATHGRGIWERLRDMGMSPASAIGLRKHLLDDRWRPPADGLTLPYADDGNLVTEGQPLQWWHGPDIKLDAPEGVPPAYQMPPSRLDFVTFETALAHRNTRDGTMNRVVVQVHNRGTKVARKVRIMLLWVSAGQTFPDLPETFWTDPSQTGDWTLVGSKTIAEISPTQPAIVYWETPFADDAAPCLLAIAGYDGIPRSTGKRRSPNWSRWSHASA
jgi:hypothetical protein